MRIACPGCGEKLTVETKYSLKKHICEKCSTKFYVPEVFGPYQLSDIVSNDETTSTHHAVQLETGKPVVVRRLRPEFKLDGTIKKVFFDETEKLKNLEIDAVVKTSFAGDVSGIPYIVLEHYGETCLKRKLRKNKYSLVESCYMFLDILGTMEPCAEQSLVHGNLKPSNIRYDEHDNVRILDFGMSAALVKALINEKTDIKLYNNPYYIAPETLKTGSLTPVSDIYCLGAIFYEMVSGEKPFAKLDPLAAMLEKQENLPEPPNHLKPGIPPALNGLIMGMIDMNPARRPQFIVQIQAIIQKVIEELEDKKEEISEEVDPEIEKELNMTNCGYEAAVIKKDDIPDFKIPEVEEKPKLLEQYSVHLGLIFVLVLIIVILGVLYFGL
ncbi:MAG: serine/threonine protein kinase [Lentisphaeraceae bacterium]|nr:serine/threonine protein kinase [Lentisphaeraceae bacterium]